MTQVIRLWDKDFNCIASGSSFDDIFGKMMITEDKDDTRRAGRILEVNMHWMEQFT